MTPAASVKPPNLRGGCMVLFFPLNAVFWPLVLPGVALHLLLLLSRFQTWQGKNLTAYTIWIVPSCTAACDGNRMKYPLFRNCPLTLSLRSQNLSHHYHHACVDTWYLQVHQEIPIFDADLSGRIATQQDAPQKTGKIPGKPVYYIMGVPSFSSGKGGLRAQMNY